MALEGTFVERKALVRIEFDHSGARVTVDGAPLRVRHYRLVFSDDQPPRFEIEHLGDDGKPYRLSGTFSPDFGTFAERARDGSEHGDRT